MRNDKCTETREYPAFAAASALRGEGVFPDLSVSPFLTIPSFVDVHVHLREPGFFYKETIRSGTLAAAHGGFAQNEIAPYRAAISFSRSTGRKPMVTFRV